MTILIVDDTRPVRSSMLALRLLSAVALSQSIILVDREAELKKQAIEEFHKLEASIIKYDDTDYTKLSKHRGKHRGYKPGAFGKQGFK